MDHRSTRLFGAIRLSHHKWECQSASGEVTEAFDLHIIHLGGQSHFDAQVARVVTQTSGGDARQQALVLVHSPYSYLQMYFYVCHRRTILTHSSLNQLPQSRTQALTLPWPVIPLIEFGRQHNTSHCSTGLSDDFFIVF